MDKVEKTLQRWRNSKQEVRVEELFPVLNRFFPDSWDYGGQRGSHVIKVTHPLLKGIPGYGPDGDFCVPTRGGQKVVFFYLKLVLKSIELISGANKP
jgi:hypothetical protein